MKKQFAFPAYSTNDGMTLRDYFAAKAMQGILSDASGINENTDKKLCLPEDAKQVALASYMMADAMLKARQE
jgi:hypothetical protein